jgi:hypothetical protein
MLQGLGKAASRVGSGEVSAQIGALFPQRKVEPEAEALQMRCLALQTADNFRRAKGCAAHQAAKDTGGLIEQAFEEDVALSACSGSESSTITNYRPGFIFEMLSLVRRRVRIFAF